MKYHISREQRFFFDQNHFIEFDGLLSANEQSTLSTITSMGRDLSHTNASIKEITHATARAKLASELCHTRKLRFGFDQLLTPPFSTKNFMNEVCIQGLALCLFLRIDSPEGHGIFALPTVDLSLLPLDPQARYLVVGWAEERSLYIMQPNDQYTHQLKKQGYVFGDRLQERWHPILTR